VPESVPFVAIKFQEFQTDPALVGVAHDRSFDRHGAGRIWDFQADGDYTADRRRGDDAHGAAAGRKIDDGTLAFDYVFFQPSRTFDADARLFAPVVVDANVANTQLEELECVTANLASERIDVERAQKPLVGLGPLRALDEFTRTIRTVEMLHN